MPRRVSNAPPSASVVPVINPPSSTSPGAPSGGRRQAAMNSVPQEAGVMAWRANVRPIRPNRPLEPQKPRVDRLRPNDLAEVLSALTPKLRRKILDRLRVEDPARTLLFLHSVREAELTRYEEIRNPAWAYVTQLDEALASAAGRGDLAEVKRLVTGEHALIGEYDAYEYGSLALRAALRAGHYDVANYLLLRGVNPAAPPDAGARNAMVTLIETGRDDAAMAKRLLEHGSHRPYPSEPNGLGLVESALARQYKIMGAILEHAGPQDVLAALSAVAHKGDAAGIRELAPAWVYPMEAADQQRLLCTTVLGGNLNSPTRSRAQEEVLQEVMRLIQPNPNAHYDGVTALMVAAGEMGTVGMVRTLLAAGADPRLEFRTNYVRFTALSRARKERNKAKIALLERACGKLEKRNIPLGDTQAIAQALRPLFNERQSTGSS